MGKVKWGESFLKSGLPLEHLTLVTFKSFKCLCHMHFEYPRKNVANNDETWFELDLVATHPTINKSTQLEFLVECKYNDESRFWFFLPHDKYRWDFNDRVLNCGPFQTLDEPKSDTVLGIAPLSTGGVVVSKDDQKQENTIYKAIQQISSGFVPYCMETLFGYNLDYENYMPMLDFIPSSTAVIPMIVTNAHIFRLKDDVANLDLIRKASSPDEIADEVDWTWCFHDANRETVYQNIKTIDDHKEWNAKLIYRYPPVVERMQGFVERPNWIAVVNIRHLSKVITDIVEHFKSLKTNTIENIMTTVPQTEKRRR